MQDGYVVCYESWKLNEHEQNYLTHDLELAAIIHALNMLRHYLLSKRFVLMIHQIGLRYLFEKPNLNSRQPIWLETIKKFDFKIRYIKGKYSRVVDALNK